MLLFSCEALAQGSIRHSFTGANVADEFGSVVNTVGDVNGDGVDDVIVGAPFDLPALGNPGSATIYCGANGSLVRKLIGTAPNQHFGLGVANAGDVDHDGIPDQIVGISANGAMGGPGGGARIFSGATGAVLRSFAGTTLNDGFGQTVAGLGDVNGDGYDDQVVGCAIAPAGTIPGYAHVYSGLDGSILYTKTGSFVGQRFGMAYPAGDVDGDGVRDFMIGAIGNNANGVNSGSACVHSGATGFLLFTVHGLAANDRLGYSGHAAGDVDNDGFGDVVVGTYIPSGIGYARVYSGNGGALLHHLTGSVAGDAFGHSVAGVGDVNGDGVPDLAVAAPNSNVGGSLAGLVRVFSGATGAELRAFVGTTADTHLGYSVNPAGDVNGDRLDDIAIGYLVPGTLGIPGKAEVVSVCAAQRYGLGLLPTQTLSASWILGGPGTESQGGMAVAGAAPFSLGVVGASLAPSLVTLYDVPVLVDMTPGLLITVDVAYNQNGYLEFPIDLRNPGLNGIAIYAQAFEFNPAAPQNAYASNGLMFLFGL